MTYQEYLQENKELIQKAQKFKESSTYMQIQEFSKTPQYKQAIEYLQKMDKKIHKDILHNIEYLQKKLLKGNETEM